MCFIFLSNHCICIKPFIILTGSKKPFKNNVLYLNEFTKENFSTKDVTSKCGFPKSSMFSWFKKYSKVSTSC